jgi:hypothetical protein
VSVKLCGLLDKRLPPPLLLLLRQLLRQPLRRLRRKHPNRTDSFLLLFVVVVLMAMQLPLLQDGVSMKAADVVQAIAMSLLLLAAATKLPDVAGSLIWATRVGHSLPPQAAHMSHWRVAELRVLGDERRRGNSQVKLSHLLRKVLVTASTGLEPSGRGRTRKRHITRRDQSGRMSSDDGTCVNFFSNLMDMEEDIESGVGHGLFP